jgi:RecJ-like exonuclease
MPIPRRIIMKLETTHYKCGNCRAKRELDHEGHDSPICPECKVNRMTEMVIAKCPECDGTDWTIEQPAPGESMAADPDAVCQECENRARVDSDGLWW